MRWSDINVNPSRSMLRQFAGLWIVLFGVLAAWHWGQQPRAAAALAALALTVGPIGLLFPETLRPVFVGWLVLAFPIGWVVSKIVLIFLWCVITLIALLFRFRGRDVLQLRRRPDCPTYWTAKAHSDDVRSYFRQY